MKNFQPGILDDVPALARYLTFSIRPGAAPAATLARLPELVDGESSVVGLGKPLLQAVAAGIAGLEDFPAYDEPGARVPSTPRPLHSWMRILLPEVFRPRSTPRRVRSSGENRYTDPPRVNWRHDQCVGFSQQFRAVRGILEAFSSAIFGPDSSRSPKKSDPDHDFWG